MAQIEVLVAVVYAAGVLIGLAGGRARLPGRVGLALLWPLGPLAFGATVVTLCAVGAIAFPRFGVLLLAAGLLAWYAGG